MTTKVVRTSEIKRNNRNEFEFYKLCYNLKRQNSEDSKKGA